MQAPRLIALCGNPNSGKSTAAKLLCEIYGYNLMDDGKPLREIAKQYIGLTHDQCYTQDGKLEKVMINDREWECRGVLGEIGNAFEEKFGGDIIPIMSHNIQDPKKRYVMGSVRREQGWYWRKQGALVIQIVNPDAPESRFEFDTFNKDAVHKEVINDYGRNDLGLDANIRILQKRLVNAVEG